MAGPTQKEVAEHLFCSTRRVREMQAEGILPADIESLDEARRLTLEWLRGRAAGKAPKTRALEDARNESLRIDIENKRLDMAERQGDLVRISVCEILWRDLCLNFRNKMLTAPNKCAARVSAEDAPMVQETVRNVVHEALEELARDPVPAGLRAGRGERASGDGAKRGRQGS
jgi:hypothetical protein